MSDHQYWEFDLQPDCQCEETHYEIFFKTHDNTYLVAEELMEWQAQNIVNFHNQGTGAKYLPPRSGEPCLEG